MSQDEAAFAGHDTVRHFFRAGVVDAVLVEESLREALPRQGDDEEAEIAKQQLLHRALFEDPITQRFSPPRASRKCFLKRILAILDEGGVSEVDDKLYAACAAGISDGPVSADEGSNAAVVHFDGYRTLEVPGSGPIVLRVTDHMGGSAETGCVLWSAGCALFGLLATGALDDVIQGHVLELGSGTGILGLALARRGTPVEAVTLTDGEPAVLENLRHNSSESAALQGFSVPTEVHLLEWASAELPEWASGPFDVVVGSDLAYDMDRIPSLVTMLRRLLRPEGTAKHAVIALARRSEETWNLLLEGLSREGLQYEDMTFSDEELWSMAVQWTHLAHDFRSMSEGAGLSGVDAADPDAWRRMICVLKISAAPGPGYPKAGSGRGSVPTQRLSTSVAMRSSSPRNSLSPRMSTASAHSPSNRLSIPMEELNVGAGVYDPEVRRQSSGMLSRKLCGDDSESDSEEGDCAHKVVAARAIEGSSPSQAIASISGERGSVVSRKSGALSRKLCGDDSDSS